MGLLKMTRDIMDCDLQPVGYGRQMTMIYFPQLSKVIIQDFYVQDFLSEVVTLCVSPGLFKLLISSKGELFFFQA